MVDNPTIVSVTLSAIVILIVILVIVGVSRLTGRAGKASKREVRTLTKLHRQLEADRTWRKLKVAYIVGSMVILAFAFYLGYISTVVEVNTIFGGTTNTDPSFGAGLSAAVVTGVVLAVLYAPLPHLYMYLKAPKKD